MVAKLLPARTSEQSKVIGVGVHIYVYIYVCGPKKFESYFSIDSPFQTFAVGLLVEFIAILLLSPETAFLVE